MTASGRERPVQTDRDQACGPPPPPPSPTHLVIHDFFSQAGCHHLLQRLLFALRLPGQLRRTVTKPGDVILEERRRETRDNQEQGMNGCRRRVWVYLHVCYLVLFPVEALHLVLLQLQSGLYILVVVTLKAKIGPQGHAGGWHTEETRFL